VSDVHKSDDFGKPAPTVIGSNLNDPELTGLSAPFLIRQRGIDERQADGILVARPPRPSVVEQVPIWAWMVGFAVMFAGGVAGLLYLASLGPISR
jgi:hypothetical protein